MIMYYYNMNGAALASLAPLEGLGPQVMEETTSPPSSFSPVRRVEPTSPMARMFTRFFPGLGDHFKSSSQPGRAVFTARLPGGGSGVPRGAL